MDISLISKKSWIPDDLEYLTIIDEKHQLVEIRMINPIQLGSEVDIRYNLKPQFSNIVYILKEHGVNVLAVKLNELQNLDLIPGKQPWVPYHISYNEHEVTIKQKGLGGGRERILGTMFSKSCLRHEIHYFDDYIDATIVTPKYHKLTVGIDSTDSKSEGCTAYLAHTIGKVIEKKFTPNVKYLKNQLSLLCVAVQEKTQNNTASALSFAVKNTVDAEIIEEIYCLLKKNSISKSAYMTILNGLYVPDELYQFGLKAKKELITFKESQQLLEKLKIDHREVTGINGMIGATAALGLMNDPENAARQAY